MLAASALTFGSIIDLFYFVKIIKTFFRLKRQLAQLAGTKTIEVSELINQFSSKKVNQKILASIRGIVQSKTRQSQKNIFSAVVTNDLIQKSTKKQFFFEKVPYKFIIEKADWIRPQNLKDVAFKVKDTATSLGVTVEGCENTDITGSLTERLSFEVQLTESKNLLITILKAIYDFILSIFPLSIFKERRKTGERITYYGLAEGDFITVTGEAFKNENGEICFVNPQYLTKQLSFLVERFKKEYAFYEVLFIAGAILHLIGLYYLGSWIYKKYATTRKIRQQYEYEDEDIPPNHECIICYSNVRSIVFKPCKHYGLCSQCYYRLNHEQCPICKENITGIIRIVKR